MDVTFFIVFMHFLSQDFGANSFGTAGGEEGIVT